MAAGKLFYQEALQIADHNAYHVRGDRCYQKVFGGLEINALCLTLPSPKSNSL